MSMSWLQLADHIRAMSHEERLQKARFAECYDNESGVFEVSMSRAAEDIVVEENGEEIVLIRKGEPYLH